MKTAKLFFFLLSFFAISALSYAQITSAASGNWSDGATWTGGIVPTAAQNVIVDSGHTVTIDIPNAACNDLTVSGYLYFSATISGMGITVNGNAVVENSARIRMASSTPGIPILFHSLDFKNNLTINSGGTFDMRQTSGANGSVGRVLFSGSSNSTISLALSTYTSTSEEFNSVVINKTGGAKVILASGNLFQNNNSSNAADTLVFISGIIETGDNVWAHLATNSEGIQGASSASYINGKLGRGISNGGGASTRTFPLGDASAYRPITVLLNAPSNSTGHYVWAELLSGDANSGSSVFTGGIDKVSENRYYEIGYMQNNGSASSMPVYGMNPSYSNDDGVAAGNTDLRVAYSTDNRTTWINAGPADHTTDLSNVPTFIESDSLSDIPVGTGTSIFVALARATGTETNIVPVELTSFSASVNQNNIQLIWNTATEKNNSGFEVEKSVDQQAYSKIGFIPGAGTSTESRSYSFIDEDLRPGKYYYRLKQVDFDGSFIYSKVVEADYSVPAEYVLMQNYPNPFNPSTTINFNLAKEGKVKISVINAIGETVKVLLNENRAEGIHQVKFNADALQSGMYFYKIEAGDFVQTKKMLLIK